MYLLDPSKKCGADLLINTIYDESQGGVEIKNLLPIKKNLLARVLNKDTVGSYLNKSCWTVLCVKV